jgi:hypothetical protein
LCSDDSTTAIQLEKRKGRIEKKNSPEKAGPLSARNSREKPGKSKVYLLYSYKCTNTDANPPARTPVGEKLARESKEELAGDSRAPVCEHLFFEGFPQRGSTSFGTGVLRFDMLNVCT